MRESTEAPMHRNGCKARLHRACVREPRRAAVERRRSERRAIPPDRRTRRLGREQVRQEVEQAAERQADDVEVVALDARDEHGAVALDGVAARSALPFARGDVPVEQGGRRRAEVDVGDLDGGVGDLAVAGEGDRADDLVGAAGQARDVLARLGRVARLAEDVAADGDEGVGAERERRTARASALRRAFSSATATGSPWVSSATFAGRTVKETPICSRIARRWGDADARV